MFERSEFSGAGRIPRLRGSAVGAVPGPRTSAEDRPGAQRHRLRSAQANIRRIKLLPWPTPESPPRLPNSRNYDSLAHDPIGIGASCRRQPPVPAPDLRPVEAVLAGSPAGPVRPQERHGDEVVVAAFVEHRVAQE